MILKATHSINILLREYYNREGMLEHDKVIGRKRDKDGNLVDRNHSNPILNMTVVVVQCDDGCVEEFAANEIAEHIFAQVDGEGNQFVLLNGIIDHKNDDTAGHANN
jgi:hypothetical protein